MSIMSSLRFFVIIGHLLLDHILGQVTDLVGTSHKSGELQKIYLWDRDSGSAGVSLGTGWGHSLNIKFCE